MTTCNNNYVSYQWGINHIISTQHRAHGRNTGRCLLARQQVTTSWSTEAPAWCRSDADHLQECVHLCVFIIEHFCSYLQSVYWSLLQFLTFPLASACFHILASFLLDETQSAVRTTSENLHSSLLLGFETTCSLFPHYFYFLNVFEQNTF